MAQPPPPAPTHGGAFGDVVEPSVNPEEAAKESYTAVSLWKQGFRQGMGNDDLGAAFANAKGGEVQPPPPSLDLEGNAFAATKVAVAPAPDLSNAFPPAPAPAPPTRDLRRGARRRQRGARPRAPHRSTLQLPRAGAAADYPPLPYPRNYGHNMCDFFGARKDLSEPRARGLALMGPALREQTKRP